MERTLYLFRHAKSDWSDATLNDYDRPLNERGRSAAPLIGRYMRKAGINPELVLCSTAARAQQTLLLALNESGWDRQIGLEAGLYLASSDRLLKRLQGLVPSLSCVMIIGHNPGLHNLACRLAEGTPDESGKMEKLYEKFPTAGLVALRCEIDDWSELDSGKAILTHMVRPRDLE